MRIIYASASSLFPIIAAVVIITIFKASLFFPARTKFWTARQFIFFSLSNIRATTGVRFSIKLINNVLTFSIILIVFTHILSVALFPNHRNQVNEEITGYILDETEASLTVETGKPLQIIHASSIEAGTIRVTNTIETSKKINNKNETVKTHGVTNKRRFSNEEMLHLTKMVKRKMLLNRSKSNCVQIIKTKNSNVENAFDLATVFRNKGFVIAGREERLYEQKGVRIDVEGAILKVIVGTL